jgi:glycosyltransferase involved in cell wall biosynthesis
VKPEVSILMAVWRPVAAWFRQAVESALGQQGCDFELVIVDDGNDEPLAPLLAGLDDGRLRVVRIEHGGQCAARNAGIENARGGWLRFADADDVLEAGSTARLLGLTERRDDVVAYGATVVCDEDLNPRRTIVSTLEGDVVDACLLGRFSVRHESMLFPKRAVEAAGGWAEGFAVSADWDFTLRVLEHVSVRGEQAPATYYRRHSQSQNSAAGVAAGEHARRRIIERYLDRHPAERGGRLARQAYSALYVDRALAYAAAGEPRSALDRLARAARLRPADAFRAMPSLLRVARR